MKYPPSFFRSGLPEWKRRKDPFLSKIIYRPLSFYASSIFCEIGWSANTVTIFSMFVAIAVFFLFLMKQPIAAAVLMNVWLLLDCADGNIARCVKREQYGDFVDGISGYICSSLAFVGIGYCVYWTGGIIVSGGNPEIILLGALAGTSEALSRLVYQRFLNTSYEQGQAANKTYNPEEASGLNKIRMKVDQAIAIGGVLPFAVFVCAIINALDLIVLVYSVYFALTFLAATVYFVRKTIVANKSA